MVRPVYLVDFAAYKPPEELRVVREELKEHGKKWPMYSEDMKDFMEKVHIKSGLAEDGTYLPESIHPVHNTCPRYDMDTARKEAEMVMFTAVQELLDKTGLKPTDIDILVTNCSIFCPTPSMASMLVNHFKMRTDIQSYHLGGMGCGNGVMAIGLIKDLLQARPNAVAVFVPAEITTYAFYPGREKARMVANVIFRMGGAAIMLTNKPSLYSRSKYQLMHNVRVHTGADDESYGCMGWGPDGEGINGVYLGKNVVYQAAKALELCMREIAPKILTWGQYAEAASHYTKQYLGYDMPKYLPDFTRCVDHFAIHAGGYAVLKGIQEALRLPVGKMLPSFAALRDFGNTSCSTTWYVLSYMESWENVQRGQTIMQVGMGGGMKAGVNIWRALRNNKVMHRNWAHLTHPLVDNDLPRTVEGFKVFEKKEEGEVEAA